MQAARLQGPIEVEEYALVAQDKMEVTLFRRAANWQPEVLRRPDEQLRLASIDFTLALNVIYEGVAPEPQTQSVER